MAEPKLDIQPFTKKDLEEILQNERRIANLLPLLQKAENCGIDCSLYRDICATQSEKLRRIRDEFMPDPELLPDG